jgi:hypothetical protein
MYCPLWKQLYNGSYLWVYIAISYLQLNEYIKKRKYLSDYVTEIYEKRNKLEHPTAISTMESLNTNKTSGRKLLFLINLKNVS